MGRIERGGGGWAVSQSKTWLAWLLSLLRPLLKAAAAFFAPVEILRARWAKEEEEKGRKGPVPPSWAGQWLVPPSCLLWSLSLSFVLEGVSPWLFSQSVSQTRFLRLWPIFRLSAYFLAGCSSKQQQQLSYGNLLPLFPLLLFLRNELPPLVCQICQ